MTEELGREEGEESGVALPLLAVSHDDAMLVAPSVSDDTPFTTSNRPPGSVGRLYSTTQLLFLSLRLPLRGPSTDNDADSALLPRAGLRAKRATLSQKSSNMKQLFVTV